MSLYNMLFGRNPNSDILLAILGLREGDVERLRDCSLDEEGISIYTRTGGGNRDSYPNEKLTSNPYYLRDVDDEFDSTYATYYFRFPEEIKEDCVAFIDTRKNGISGNLIRWVLNTLERKETDGDKWMRLWKTQNKLVQESKQTRICETNGHTIVPLDDRSLEIYLKLMEEANGEQLGYSVVPYKVLVSENVPLWTGDQEMCRVKVSFPKNWEIDTDLWNHWTERFRNKYPKAISTIAQNVRALS